MALIRIILGKLILFFNWAFPPKRIKRGPQQQSLVDQQTNSLTVYQYKACPFCVKVRRQMKLFRSFTSEPTGHHATTPTTAVSSKAGLSECLE